MGEKQNFGKNKEAKMSDSCLFLQIPGYSSFSCKIHPVVVFTILDHFNRRQEGQFRVIGTLLGTKVDSVLEITTCFAVPHSETKPEVEVDMEYHQRMCELHQKANPTDIVLGWYSTGSAIDANSVLIHYHYWKEMQSAPIHVTVDTNLTNNRMDLFAYMVNPLGLGAEESVGHEFQRIPLALDTSDTEQASLETLMRCKQSDDKSAPLETDVDSVTASLSDLLEMLNTIIKYVDNVVEGKAESDRKIGRLLATCVDSLPKINPVEFERLFSNSLQDKLMVVYLANLTRTQLALAEKLQTLQ